MMKTLFTAAALIALPLTAASAQAPIPAATYVTKAGASDLYERTSSQLVLATTANPKLKSFAHMMITDHTKSTAEVKAAATGAHVRVAPPRLDAMGARNVAALRAARGTARDRLYVTQQKAAHEKALALQQGYAAHGTVPGLKRVAANIVPVVKTHIAELRTM
jgi:putative membrane protein